MVMCTHAYRRACTYVFIYMRVCGCVVVVVVVVWCIAEEKNTTINSTKHMKHSEVVNKEGCIPIIKTLWENVQKFRGTTL